MHSYCNLIILTVNKSVIAVSTVLPCVHSSCWFSLSQVQPVLHISGVCLCKCTHEIKHSAMARTPNWQWLDYLAPHDTPTSLILSMKHITLHKYTYLPIMETRYRRHYVCYSWTVIWMHIMLTMSHCMYVVFWSTKCWSCEQSWNMRFIVTPVDRYQCSERNCSLHLLERRRSQFLSFPKD
jgi:hypothetical protein